MKRTPWPRWAKILRNVLLAVLLVFLAWDAWGRPTITAQGALRKREREMLLPESTAAVEVKDMGPSHWVIQTDGAAMLAQVTRGNFFTNITLRLHPLQEGPALYSFNWTATLPDEFGQPNDYIVYAAFHPPEGAVSAVLTLHNDNGDFVIRGVPTDDFFLFYVRPNPENGRIIYKPYWYNSNEYTYELAFYYGDESLIEEVSH